MILHRLILRRRPELGENNDEFLKSLGYDEAKIAEFKEKGII